jgi:hypothetical protein
LKPLSESEEEEEERIALVMSSFFYIDEGGFEEKDTTSTILAPKGVMLPAADVAIPRSPKLGLTAVVVTPSAIIIVEEKVGSLRNLCWQKIKVKGLQKLKRPKRLLKMIHPLVRGL